MLGKQHASTQDMGLHPKYACGGGGWSALWFWAGVLKSYSCRCLSWLVVWGLGSGGVEVRE